ncbi:MAG: DUF2007 domain-containing protein [Muribaculaceae bacterium]|nr:DUF2007 domain-containing protein [Muribaculaceae bacterium]
MNPDSLVTLYTYSDAFEAGVDRALLVDSGIPCFIKNEIINQVYPIGGSLAMELIIRAADFDEACRILHIHPESGLKQST